MGLEKRSRISPGLKRAAVLLAVDGPSYRGAQGLSEYILRPPGDKRRGDPPMHPQGRKGDKTGYRTPKG
ncbi:MAG TPA: hypothetical protein GX507_00045 [Clostridia bacterium]|nr:hypothetical protein [Clostridia bacterium]